jgi:hypothetical protein
MGQFFVFPLELASQGLSKAHGGRTSCSLLP